MLFLSFFFKVMPQPEPTEKKEDFIKRCIPIVLDEGTAKTPDQAVAICNAIYIKEIKDKWQV